MARTKLVPQHELGRNRLFLRIGGDCPLDARIRLGLRSAAQEDGTKAEVAPLCVQKPCSFAQRRVRWNEEPERELAKRRNRIHGPTEVRRPSLFAAEESIRGRTLELRDQLLVVPAVRGLPVHAAEALAPAGDVSVVDSKQRSYPDARTKLRVGPRGDDVTNRDRSLIELPPFELAHRGKRRQPLNLQRQSLLAQNDEALRATNEPERAWYESRRGADDGQCVRKAAPGISEPYVQSRRRRCRDRRVGEEPARGCAVEVLDPSQRRGDRRSRTAGERPASEVVRCCPRRAETGHDRAGRRVSPKRRRVESPRQRQLVASSSKRRIEGPVKVAQRDPHDVRRPHRTQR